VSAPTDHAHPLPATVIARGADTDSTHGAQAHGTNRSDSEEASSS
jgi:hypothetical protein